MTNKRSILFTLFLLAGITAFSQTIEFIENRGQWDSKVQYMGRVSAGAFFVHQDGFTVLQHDTGDWARLTNSLHGHNDDIGASTSRQIKDEITVKSHAYRVNFLGGATQPQIVADKPVASVNNYFIGNDPTKWATGCKIFQGITLKNIYPNIDVRYYSGQGSVKYDLIVHPGGNPADIAMKYDGAQGLEVKNKELRIKTSVGELKELDPYTYQYSEKGRVSRNVRYSVKGDVVRFDVKDYDPTTTLVIDPDLIFCSFSGSTADNWGYTATYGPDGSMYGGGVVFGNGFPVSPGGYQVSYGSGSGCLENGFDMGIIKLSPDGKSRVYATYLGGQRNEMPQSLIVNAQGELIIGGRTDSRDFPTAGPNSRPTAGGGWDIVVAKFNAAGILNGCKIVGGTADDGANITPCASSTSNSLIRNYGDQSRSEINIDGAGNIYLASCTQSTDFYLLNAVQTVNGGGVHKQDGVLLKFDPSLSNILFSTYLGGDGDDAAYVLSIHPQNGNIYVAGGTASTNFRGAAAGTIGPVSFGAIDGFISVFTPDGLSLIRSSYIGTGGVDQIYGIQFDGNGFPYIMGQTTGVWPVVNAAWSQANGKQFISKLRPDLSGYVYSTVFGKGQAVPDISPVAFLVDRCENVYISGWGGRIGNQNFPNAGVLGLPTTPDALKSAADPGASGTGEDFYFFVLKKDAVSQLYGSFFGQNNGEYGDHVDGGTSRFDRNGVIYQAICASCGSTGPFPTYPSDVWRATKPAQANCNLAMVKIAFKFAGAQGDVRPSINGVPRDSIGCVPLTIDFTDTIQEAPAYEWYFGDGKDTVTTSPTVTHTYFNVGSYLVMMVAIDSTKCFPRDTSYVTVKVGDNQALPRFNAVKLSPPCDTFRYRFDNTTIAPPGIPFKPKSFTWDFGDGSATVTGGANSVFHTYANAGSYVVKLTLNDTAYCNSPETYIDTLRVAANVKAVFVTSPKGCAPYDAVFKNQSVGGQRFTWDFGDGTIATSPPASPTHTYTVPGTYLVTLTAIDSNTCNFIDVARLTITVAAAPTADFDFAPQPPQVNTPISFTNLSSFDAVRFKWVWGDGDSLLTTSRGVVQHEFNLTDKYRTCLTAYNTAGCEAVRCNDVSSIADPAVDVPNAFTPQSGDVNSRVFVRGFGIAKVRFAIYARWGEKVFETADKRMGWDGRFKGQLLPMDAYAYTLEVEFIDGKRYQKKGDITLIR
ncbi:MAG TPA: PKD domain-containing protein [Flavisolibacter sp.]|nr:PKD domain-containing protein [Flavisolibacter sp.]